MPSHTEFQIGPIALDAFYPSFSATTGGTFIALLAGTYVATKPTSSNNPPTAIIVIGSCPLT